MSNKPVSRRNLRKAILKRFEKSFDLGRLDYVRRTKAGQDRAKLIGVFAAMLVYFSLFGLVFYSWNQHWIDDNAMNKMGWILMVPSSVVGAIGWMIASNRFEFPVRQDVRYHIDDFETEQGTLWRYQPLLEKLTLKKINIAELIEASRNDRLVMMAPEEVCATIRALHALLTQSGPALITPEELAAVAANFNDLEDED
jgi:hypothetical protein